MLFVKMSPVVKKFIKLFCCHALKNVGSHLYQLLVHGMKSISGPARVILPRLYV